MTALASVLRVYTGSDGEATKSLYAQLEALGPLGVIAMNVFRATKCSERAKAYRGGGHRSAAYERKQWSMDNLCEALTASAEGAGITWGWGVDEEQPFHRHVLYVDLPTGQVSFHTHERGSGPEYLGKWDGMRGHAADRICRWVGRLLAAEQVPA